MPYHDDGDFQQLNHTCWAGASPRCSPAAERVPGQTSWFFAETWDNLTPNQKVADINKDRIKSGKALGQSI